MQSQALSVRPDGFAWAVWGDTRAGATNQDVWGSRYDPALNSWSTPLRLDDDPGTTTNQLNPTVAFGPAEVMLAWRDNRLNANGNTQARRVQVTPGMSDHFVLSYDGLSRLRGVSGPVVETFALDGASNVTNRSGTAETYDASNRLTQDGSTALTWSDADRLTNRGSDTFGYDALDRLTSSTVGGTARTYAYNGDGLVQTRSGGVAATFLWDPSTSIQRELKQNGDNIVYGFGPLYVVKADATTLTFARDGSKNVRAEVSSAGAVTAAFRYRAYGQLAQSTTSGPTYLGFASQLIDPSGLYYMRARWYDPASGRFISRDPLAFVSSMDNPYGYGAANPMSYGDASGLRVDIVSGGRAPCTCVAPVPQKPTPGDPQPAPVWTPKPGVDCCITVGVARGPLTLIFPMPPKLEQIFRDKTPEEVFEDPDWLVGKTPDDIESQAGWREARLREGSAQGKGRRWIEDPGDRLLQFHPGGGHHGVDPYWKLAQGNAPTQRIQPGGDWNE